MTPVEALVTPEVMRWARKARGFHTVDEAAKKIGRPPDEIVAWEDGTARPTMAQARKAAEVYKRPLAVFYLPEPPTDFQVLKDFRRLPTETEGDFSPNLLLLIRESVSKQQWLRSYLEEEGAEPVSFVGSADTDVNASSLAERVRAAIGISIEDQQACRTREDALALWIDRAEAAHVFVSRDSAVPCEEARGIALPDDYAPFIFVNSKDAKAAQVFTLAHELVHLWINASGVSNLGYRGQWQIPEARVIETFCNRVAGQMVLPEVWFERIWNGLPTAVSIEERIERVSDRCKVSSEVVARRLLDKHAILESKYQELRDSYRERWRELREAEAEERKRKDEPPPPLYYPLAAMRNGHSFTRIVLGAYFGGSVTGREASSLLNVKVGKFGRLAKQVKLYLRTGHGGGS